MPDNASNSPNIDSQEKLLSVIELFERLSEDEQVKILNELRALTAK